MTAPNLTRRAAVYLALCTVVISQPLLQLYGGNLAVFTTAKFEGLVVFLFGLAVVSVPAVVAIVVDLFLTRVLRRDALAVHTALVFAGFWMLGALVFRSVSVGPWVADAALYLLPATVLTFAYLRAAGFRRWITWVSPLSVVVLAMFTASTSAIVWPASADAATSVVSVVSPDPTVDVVWIQLDEAALFPLLKSDGTVNEKRFPGFARLASVSTWYRNVLSVSQHTSVAVPAMLTGRSPDYDKQPILQDHPDNLFTLMRNRMQLDVVEAVTSMCTDSWCRPGVDAAAAEPATMTVQGRVPFRDFLRDAAVVLGHKILPAQLRERLPAIDEGWGGFGHEEDAVTVGAPKVESGGSVSLTGHAARIAALRELVEREAQGTDPALRFIHVMLPHRPWVLAPDRRKSADPVMDTRPVTMLDRRRDAYQSFLNQYVALDAEIGTMVDTLQKSPRWDKTMLIVTADHGLTFVPGVSYRDRIDTRRPETYEDIYRVPLFVKYPSQESPQVNDCTASVLDIVATIEKATGVTSPWTNEGSDLKSACPERATRTVTWPKGKAEVTTGVDALLERVRYYGKWIASDGDVDDIYRSGAAGVLLGTAVPSGAPVDKSLTWTLENGAEFETVGSGTFAHVPTRVVGHVTASRDLVKGEEVLVAVDGVFVAEAPEVVHVKAGDTAYFSASVMSRLVAAGSHSVSLWLATPSTDGYRIARLAN